MVISIRRPGPLGELAPKRPGTFFIPAIFPYICCTMETVPNSPPHPHLVLSGDQIAWLVGCATGTVNYDIWTGLVSVKGNFDCSSQGLSDLKGVRFGTVTGYFNADNNLFSNLDGFPREVWSHLYISNNHLTSLEGGPREVGGHLTPHNNLLTSLKGFPLKLGGKLFVTQNPVSDEVLIKIGVLMKSGKSYRRAVEFTYRRVVERLWSEIPLDDQVLLYRPEFGWVGEEERRKLEALMAYERIKNML